MHKIAHFIEFYVYISNVRLRMYQCTDVFTAHHFLQVAYSVHIEHDNRKLVFLAHASSSQVHYLETTSQNFVVSDVVEL